MLLNCVLAKTIYSICSAYLFISIVYLFILPNFKLDLLSLECLLVICNLIILMFQITNYILLLVF